MTDTVTVVTNPSTNTVEIVSAGPQGPQGPQGVKGDVGDVNPDMITLRDAAAASASAAAGSASSASTSATTATTQASSASGSASTATSQATIATNQATTATTKAGEASTSATNAAASAGTASSSATTATTKASEASTSASNAAGSASTAISQAALATTKAAEADASATAAAGSASSASTSASTASTQATNAANSASTATSAAATATTQATNASTSATTATTKANDAANSATTAQNAATNADTKATEASVSAVAAAASQSAAAVSASGAAAGAATSTAKASEAAASAAAINATFGNAASVAALAQTAQAQASLAQGYAASASSVVQQDLSGVTVQALHRSPNAITAQFIYDTSKDSDGGAWTEKCQQTSWYNEALAGKWLGPQDSEFQARNSGSTISATELVTNGNFDTDVSGWLTAGCTVSKSGSAMRITDSDGGTGYAYRSVTLEIGKTYFASVRVTLDAITGSLTLYMGTTSGSAQMGSSSLANGPGTISFFFTATATTGWIAIRNVTAIAGEYWEVDNVSVREVTALNTASNDYFQLSTDGKFYRLWKNLVSYSEQFDNAYWGKAAQGDGVAPTVTANFGNAPTGAATADRVQFSRSTTSVGNRSRITITPSLQPLTYTYSVYMKSNTGSSYTIVMANTSSSTSAKAVTVTPSWQRFDFPFLAASGTNNLWIGLIDTNTTDLSADILMWGAQLEISLAVTDYEAKVADGTTSEIFRGNKADFPRLAAIVAEAGNVNIYDLTEPGRPMWMRFFGGNSSCVVRGNNLTCITSFGGFLYIGHGTSFGLAKVDFVNDKATLITTSGEFLPRNISNRNDTSFVFSTATNTAQGPSVVNAAINAVAMTVLPDAPIDPATGLRVPTIAVATSGGVSVIKHNGTVVSTASANSFHHVYIDRNILMYSRTGDRWVAYALNPGSLGASFAQILMGTNPDEYQSANPVIERFSGRSAPIRFISPTVKRKWNNEALPTRGLNMSVAPTFNTGWMTGDIRRAYLSDVTAESIGPGANVVTNGDFASDVSGWTAHNGGSIAWSSGAAVVTGAGANTTGVYQPITCVIGKTYRFQVTCTLGTATIAEAAVNASALGSGGSLGNTYGFFSSSQTFVAYFTATATTHSVVLMPRGVGLTATFDNVSVQEVVLDRSYKAQGAAVTGTLTKSQLASGTSLVGFSGYSGSNYLREPYSADLDFGTGEWNASAWVNVPSSALTANYPVYGSDLLAGAGAFTSSTGWTGLSADCTVSGGSFAKTGGSTHYVTYPLPALTQGDVLLVKFDVVAINGGIVVRIGHAPGWNASVGVSTTGTHYRVFTAFSVSYGNVLGIDLPGTLTATIQNLTVYKVKPSAILSRSFSSGAYIELAALGGNYLRATAYDGTTTRTVTFPPFTGADSNPVISKDTWLKAEANYTTDGSLTIRVNGREVAATRGNPLLTLNSNKYNLLTFTEQFDNAAWLKYSVAVPATKYADPYGGTTANLLYPTAATTDACIYRGGFASVSKTHSYYVKSAGKSWFCILKEGTTGGAAWFNLSTGSVGTVAAGYTAPPPTSLGNGWYRCSVTSTSGFSQYTAISAVDADNSTTPTPNGTDGIYIWGAQLETGSVVNTYQRVGAATDFDFAAPFTIGNNYTLDGPFPGTIALLKLGATVPTPEQAQFMYEQEKQLFRANALSVLPDTGAVVDMAYDDATDRWVAVSAANESYWTGLVRNTVTPVPAGSYTKIVATSGIELAARSTTNPGVDVTIPAYGLREELVKRAEAAARLSKELAIYDYVGGFTGNTTSGSTAIASVSTITYPGSYIGARISGSGIPANTTIVAVSGTTLYLSAAATATATGVSITFLDFALPAGMETKTVMSAGSVKQEGSTKDYTRLYDGFIETIRFGAAPGVTAWVQIAAQRITLQ